MTTTRWPWLSLAVVAACVAAGLISGGGEPIQYERSRIGSGEFWRLLTGQMVHWTPRMAIVDLGVLLMLGAWLEATGRRRPAALAMAASALLCAAAVHLAPSGPALYRGSSGIASALFVLLCLVLIAGPGGLGVKGLCLTALTLFAVKAAWESGQGVAWGAGVLPDGVVVTPQVHLLGGLGGALAAAVAAGGPFTGRLRRREAAS